VGTLFGVQVRDGETLVGVWKGEVAVASADGAGEVHVAPSQEYSTLGNVVRSMAAPRANLLRRFQQAKMFRPAISGEAVDSNLKIFTRVQAIQPVAARQPLIRSNEPRVVPRVVVVPIVKSEQDYEREIRALRRNPESYDRAMSAISDYEKSYPDGALKSSILEYKVFVLRKLGRLNPNDEAQLLAEHAKADPSRYYELGNLYATRLPDQTRRAIAAWREYIRLNPRGANIQEARLNLCEQLGKAACEAYLSHHANGAYANDAAFLLAEALRESNLSGRAVTHYSRYLKNGRDPQRRKWALYYRAQCFAKLHRFTEAKADLQLYIQQYPEDPFAEQSRKLLEQW
jgi:hypothetical protein